VVLDPVKIDAGKFRFNMDREKVDGDGAEKPVVMQEEMKL